MTMVHVSIRHASDAVCHLQALLVDDAFVDQLLQLLILKATPPPEPDSLVHHLHHHHLKSLPGPSSFLAHMVQHPVGNHLAPFFHLKPRLL